MSDDVCDDDLLIDCLIGGGDWLFDRFVDDDWLIG